MAIYIFYISFWAFYTSGCGIEGKKMEWLLLYIYRSATAFWLHISYIASMMIITSKLLS